jgi:hypothetical protein
MRAMLAFAIILLSTIGGETEPEYPTLLSGYVNDAVDSTAVFIESSIPRGDRLAVAGRKPRASAVETSLVYEEHLAVAAEGPRLPVIEDLHPDLMNGPLTVVASADPNVDAAIAADAANEAANQPSAVSMSNLCDTLYASAENNDLPVPFFANLIWQESRMKVDDVSKKGAQGIAQFMPKVAVEKGLANPFDPMQALPASAKLLRELHLQFGNLGFVAAAYNAGPNRVIAWLERRTDLPRETRNYVVKVTGLSVDAWRNMPVDGNALTFVGRLPCRSMPAYANVEQTQSAQTQSVQASLDDIGLGEPADDTALADDAPTGSITHKSDRTAERRTHKHENRKDGHEARRTDHEHGPAKREAAHKPRSPRDKKAA